MNHSRWKPRHGEKAKAKETDTNGKRHFWQFETEEEDPKAKRFFWKFEKSMEFVFRRSKKKPSVVERLKRKRDHLPTSFQWKSACVSEHDMVRRRRRRRQVGLRRVGVGRRRVQRGKGLGKIVSTVAKTVLGLLEEL